MSQWDGQPMGETIRRGTKTLTTGEIREAMRVIGQRGPRKVGDGPAAFTATTVIDRQPFRWDTNCFYRRLGLDTSVSRLDILRRFLALDLQQDFLRLAVAASVLLSKEKRSRYDALILGTFWGEDPDLIDTRVRGELGGQFDNEWAVYADPKITDQQARALSSEWRTMMVAELAPRLAHLDQAPFIGVGVTPTVFTARWEQVGMYAVFFVPLDAVPTPEYVRDAADELLRIATPMVI